MKTITAAEWFSPLSDRARMTVFLLKVFPMLPSKPVDWFTSRPRVEKVTYPVLHGYACGDLYRPSTPGRHRAIVVFLGVVPFGTDHPQVPRLGEALARAGFAALLYWSPAMRDLRLEPEDIENVAIAYDWLIRQPYVDAERSGILGTCVGGSFALMAAAHPRIRDRVSFVAAYAPYSSLFSLVQDAASSSTVRLKKRESWKVDQLTRRVLVRSLTADLEPAEAERVREACSAPGNKIDRSLLSAEARQLYALLSGPGAEEAQEIMERLPEALRERLSLMSPLRYLKDIQAPLMVLFHDRGDCVIPVGESRRLMAGLASRPGVHYRELQFQHLNPAKLPLLRLITELGKFFAGLYPLFRSDNRIDKRGTGRQDERKAKAGVAATWNAER